ncbi:MAG: hypothetical protein QHC65_07195 [Sphingomonas sp.]|nr:hypothetical protein [Sphingomonas sp.]MDX3884190.1 hypothetical protein [Sphingomonas sp.]
MTAFGLGSIVTALIQSWLAQRSKQDDRRFQEKQAAYVGLLEAYHRAVMEDTDETSKAFGYWQMRCALIAPQSVRDAIRRIPETNDDQPQRSKALDALEAAIRADLGITK